MQRGTILQCAFRLGALVLAGAICAIASSWPVVAQETTAGEVSDAVVTVNRPGEGERVRYAAQPGATYDLRFRAHEAQASIVDSHLILKFDNQGLIVFENLVQLVEAGGAPIIQLEGKAIPVDVVINQAQSLTPEQDDDFSFAPLPELRRLRRGE